MISLDKLMNLSEAATGFKGGSIVDELPGLSLTEATAGLPVVILESQIELNESVMAQNEALVESVIVGLQSGTQADVDSLTEGAFETLVNKIKAFFEKLRKWVNSIIAKLTVQIDKVRLSGTQMLAKYKDSKMLDHSFEDLTVNGYKFEKKDPFTSVDSLTDPAALIAQGVPGMVSPDSFKTMTDEKDMEAKLEKLKEISSADRRLAFAKALTNGIDLNNGDSWQSELKKELYGDKVDLKFGTDFTLESVKADLQGEDLDKIKNAYAKLKTNIDKNEDSVRKAAEEFKKDPKNSASQGKDVPKRASLANTYFSTYLNIYQDCTAVIGAVQDIRVNYTKTKVGQAKTIFARMLTYKKKDNNDASGIDEIDLLDFEL